MSNSYYWAWLKMKKREDIEVEHSANHDYVLMENLIDVILNYKLPKGDGKFSRVASYVENVRGFIDFVKHNWLSDADEPFTAFLMGLDVTFEAMERMLEIIKKGR